MICENCQKDIATVHISSWRTVTREVSNQQTRETFEYHFCELCFTDLKRTNYLLNPLLRADPSARAMNVKVIKVSDTAIEVEITKEKCGACQGRYIFLRTMLPQDYAIEGMEFKMLATERELTLLQGKSY